MKLHAAQRNQVEEQLEVEAIPEDHPLIPDLAQEFGDHSFFVDDAGLKILEANPSSNGLNGIVVRVASWAGDKGSELLSHAPEVLPLTIDLQCGHPPQQSIPKAKL